MPECHYVWCQPDVRKNRIETRDATRDLPKLADWENYVSTGRETPPVFPQDWIDTSADP